MRGLPARKSLLLLASTELGCDELSSWRAVKPQPRSPVAKRNPNGAACVPVMGQRRQVTRELPWIGVASVQHLEARVQSSEFVFSCVELIKDDHTAAHWRGVVGFFIEIGRASCRERV